MSVVLLAILTLLVVKLSTVLVLYLSSMSTLMFWIRFLLLMPIVSKILTSSGLLRISTLRLSVLLVFLVCLTLIFSIMPCLESFRPLPLMEAPTMPDGSKALLPIDQSASNEHQLSAHGWPPNNIQEYANTENKSLQEMFLKNVEKVAGQVDEFAGFTPEQKAALCFNRAAQTASEFCDEALRIDRVRQRLAALKVNQPVADDSKIQFDPQADGDAKDE